MEAPTWCLLGRTTQPSLQSSHFFARHTADGVVRSARGGHSLALTCSDGIIAAGALRSARVVLREHRHYYGPLGLPLRDARFRLRLIRAASPRHGLRRRASRVPHLSLHACCAPYPAGAIDALRCSRRWCCLRREMTGSAPGLFLCRGCRLHFMLRPACLLLAARLAPPRELSTPRSGMGISPRYLGPATRCTDACRGGACTRWRDAASRSTPNSSASVCVTTHHPSSIHAPPDDGVTSQHRGRPAPRRGFSSTRAPCSRWASASRGTRRDPPALRRCRTRGVSPHPRRAAGRRGRRRRG